VEVNAREKLNSVSYSSFISFSPLRIQNFSFTCLGPDPTFHFETDADPDPTSHGLRSNSLLKNNTLQLQGILIKGEGNIFIFFFQVIHSHYLNFLFLMYRELYRPSLQLRSTDTSKDFENNIAEVNYSIYLESVFVGSLLKTAFEGALLQYIGMSILQVPVVGVEITEICFP
jgi:hypothetical protein